MSIILFQINSKATKDNWTKVEHNVGGNENVLGSCNPFSGFGRNSCYRRTEMLSEWEVSYLGRTTINRDVVVHGYVVPSHGKFLQI